MEIWQFAIGGQTAQLSVRKFPGVDPDSTDTPKMTAMQRGRGFGPDGIKLVE